MISAFLPKCGRRAPVVLDRCAVFRVALTAYRYFPAAKVSWSAGLLGAALATLGWGSSRRASASTSSSCLGKRLRGGRLAHHCARVVYVMSIILLFGESWRGHTTNPNSPRTHRPGLQRASPTSGVAPRFLRDAFDSSSLSPTLERCSISARGSVHGPSDPNRTRSAP